MRARAKSMPVMTNSFGVHKHKSIIKDGIITLKTYMNFLLLEKSLASLRFTTCNQRIVQMSHCHESIQVVCVVPMTYMPIFICGIQ